MFAHDIQRPQTARDSRWGLGKGAILLTAVLLIAACTSDDGTEGDQAVVAAESTIGSASNDPASPETIDTDPDSTAEANSASTTSTTSGSVAEEASETSRTVPTTRSPASTTTNRSTTNPSTTSPTTARPTTETSSSTTTKSTTTRPSTTRPSTTITPLRTAEVRVTVRGETKTSNNSVSFEVDSTKGVDFTYSASNGAGINLSSVQPSSICAVEGDRFRFIEDAARGGDVCVISLAVSPIDGYEASTVVVNITGGSECYETYTIIWNADPVPPGTEVTFTVDYDDGGTNCRTKNGCRTKNLVLDEHSGCWPDSATIADNACAIGATSASLTVYSLSSGDNLFNDTPATATWPIDCSANDAESSSLDSATSPTSGGDGG